MLLKYAKSLQGISGEQLSSLSLCTEMLKGFRLLKMNSKDGLFYSQDKHIFLMMCLLWAETLSQAEGKGSPRACN